MHLQSRLHQERIWVQKATVKYEKHLAGLKIDKIVLVFFFFNENYTDIVIIMMV